MCKYNPQSRLSESQNSMTISLITNLIRHHKHLSEEPQPDKGSSLQLFLAGCILQQTCEHRSQFVSYPMSEGQHLLKQSEIVQTQSELQNSAQIQPCTRKPHITTLWANTSLCTIHPDSHLVRMHQKLELAWMTWMTFNFYWKDLP